MKWLVSAILSSWICLVSLALGTFLAALPTGGSPVAAWRMQQTMISIRLEEVEGRRSRW